MVIKEYELNRLRKYLVLGLPPHEICQVMKISRATYFRYMRRIHKQDKDMMLKDSQNKMISTIQTFQDRIGQTVFAMSQIERDKNKTDFVRMQAARIKLEASWAGAVLQGEGPTIITRMSRSVQDIAYGKHKPPITDDEIKALNDGVSGQQDNNNNNNNETYVLNEDNRYPARPLPPIPKPPLSDWGEQQQEEDQDEEGDPFDPTNDPDPDPSFTKAWQEQQEKRKRRLQQQ